MAYPDASNDLLQLATDWTNWLFALDDALSQERLAKSPLEMREFVNRLAAIVYRHELPDDAISAGLWDLCTRVAALGGQVTFTSFAGHVIEYFEACLWEAENRAARKPPPLALFEIMRSSAAAVRTYLDLVDLAIGASLPAEVRQHPAIQRAKLAVGNIRCSTNDVLWCSMEQSSGDAHNRVLLLASELGLSFDEAVSAVVASADSEVRVLERFANCVPSFGLEAVNSAARLYLRALTAVARGTIDWTTETARSRASAA
jgi:5-epi-alpha-selinene synthase